MNDSKKHILDIAFKLFLQKNFKEVTMSEIVEKTGLSKGAFYHYFKSKEELFEEVANKYYLSEWVIDYDSLDKSSLTRYCNDYLEMVNNSMNKVREMFSEKDDTQVTMNYYLLIFDALKILPGFGERMVKMHENEFNSMRQAVVNARKNGEIKSGMSDEQIANIFLFITDGIGMRAIMYGSMSSMAIEIKKFWDSFYESLKV